jgi:hypothetical protein
VFVIGDAQLLPHPPQHLQAAGHVDVALGQGFPHHPLVGLVPLAAAKPREHPGQHVHLLRIEIAEAAPLQEAPHVQAELVELADELRAAETLQAYLDVYTHHYLQAKHQLPPDLQGPAHARWQGLKKS